jgi:hypothetical protein
MADQTVTREQTGPVDTSILRYGLPTAIERQRAKDRARTSLQAPISQTKQCVMYLANGRERRSPWFYRDETARRALELMQAKYGVRNCIIYVD